MVTYNVPKDFPVDRMVSASEIHDRWGPVEVRDAEGNRLERTTHICVETGEVRQLVFNKLHDGSLDILRDAKGSFFELLVKYPAPLSARILP
jgi:hypothetical protein